MPINRQVKCRSDAAFLCVKIMKWKTILAISVLMIALIQ
ncbi:hypothetical protein SX4_3539 [Vibrio mimicus SX-4]|nr:hypothetical protein SX4_3539 [Vibrio mimicus SX-4]